MTEKEPIMIDDVDVSECEFYNKVIGEDAYCNIDEEHLCTCISYDNCYYKQLKRKEQECEFWGKELDRTHLLMLERQDELVKEILKNDQLKTDNEILEKDKANLDAIIETLKAQFNQLEKENLKLKELVKTRIEDLCDSCGASSMMPMPCKVYKQALQEIIKIAEVQQSWNEWNSRYSETESEDDVFAYNWSALKQILQKCEALKDE